MIPTSTSYKQLFNAGAIQEYYVEVGTAIYYYDKLYGTITINENIYEQDTFCIGSCCASQMEFIINDPNIIVNDKDIVKFYYRYTSANHKSEWIKKFEGIIISKVQSDYGRITLTSANYLKNDEKYSRLIKSIITYPASARTVARVISERIGLTLYNEYDIADIILYKEPDDEDTLIDMLKEIALLSCGNWTISQNSLKLIVQNSNIESVGEYGVGDIDYLGTLPNIEGIALYDNNNNVYTSGSTNDNDYTLQFQTNNANQESADYIYSILKEYTYNGYRNTRAYIDPAIEPGDYYTMYGSDGEKQLCVMMTWIFDGSCICNVECPYTDIQSSISKASQDIENEINKAMPFLIYDYNEEEINSNNNEEKYVGMLPINITRDNVDADAGFRTNIKVNNSGILTERFYRDGTEELFSPVIMDLKEGRHLISDDHAYLNLSKGKHTFISSLQFEGGDMEIEPRKTLYTIEASRIGYKDLSIEGKIIDMVFSGSKMMGKENPYPNEVWLLVRDVETNILDIKHFTYNYEDVNNVKIIDDIDYDDNIVNGAIAFDGYWEKSKYYENKKIFVDNGLLKVSLIDTNGALNYYNYNSPMTILHNIEPNNVVDVSLIRGWNFKNIFTNTNEMGMIVSYIMSDGHLYYKTIYDTIDPIRYEIRYPQAIYPLKEIRTFRTNDYRIGFSVVDNNNNIWTALTDRYFQGDSVESVYLKSSFEEKNMELGFSNIITPTIIDGNNIDNENVMLEFEYPAHGTTDNIVGIYLQDSKSTPQKYYPIDNKITHLKTDRILKFKVNNSDNQMYSIIPYWGIYESAKGIGDAKLPLYAVLTNTNLKAEHGYGGAPPVIWNISNQTKILESMIPIGTPFPDPITQLRTDMIICSLENSNIEATLNEITNEEGNHKENLSAIISDNTVDIISFVEIIITPYVFNYTEEMKLLLSLSETNISVSNWTIISDDPL